MKLCAILAVVASVRVNGAECDAAPAEVDDEVTLLSIHAAVSQRAATKKAMREPDEDLEVPDDLRAWANGFSRILRTEQDNWPKVSEFKDQFFQEINAIGNHLDRFLAQSARPCDPDKAEQKCETHTPCIELVKGRQSDSRQDFMWLNPQNHSTAQVVSGNDADARTWTCTREYASEEARREEINDSCELECDNQRQHGGGVVGDKAECKQACRDRDGQFSLVGTWNCPRFYSEVITITEDYADDFTDTRTTESIKVCALGPPMREDQCGYGPDQLTVAYLRTCENSAWAILNGLEHKINDLAILSGRDPQDPMLPTPRWHQFRGSGDREVDAEDLEILRSTGLSKLASLCQKLFALFELSSSLDLPDDVCVS